MRNTKIVVVSLREILKSSLFALIGVLLIVLMVYLFTPNKEMSSSIYNEGIYTAEINLFDEPAIISVTVNEDKIVNLELSKFLEKHQVFYPLVEPTFEDVAHQILNNQSTDITSSSDVIQTSKTIVLAVEEALLDAQIN